MAEFEQLCVRIFEKLDGRAARDSGGAHVLFGVRGGSQKPNRPERIFGTAGNAWEMSGSISVKVNYAARNRSSPAASESSEGIR